MSSWAAAPVHWDRLGVEQQPSGGAKETLTLLAHWACEAGRQTPSVSRDTVLLSLIVSLEFDFRDR